jgi:hypothetical protein
MCSFHTKSKKLWFNTFFCKINKSSKSLNIKSLHIMAFEIGELNIIDNSVIGFFVDYFEFLQYYLRVSWGCFLDYFKDLLCSCHLSKISTHLLESSSHLLKSTVTSFFYHRLWGTRTNFSCVGRKSLSRRV